MPNLHQTSHSARRAYTASIPPLLRPGSAIPVEAQRIGMLYAHTATIVATGGLGTSLDSLTSVKSKGAPSDGGASALYAAVNRLGAMESRINGGWVLERQKASQRRFMRPISYRALVDGFCIEELSFNQILERHDWSQAVNYRQALRAGLIEVLTNMSQVVIRQTTPLY